MILNRLKRTQYHRRQMTFVSDDIRSFLNEVTQIIFIKTIRRQGGSAKGREV